MNNTVKKKVFVVNKVTKSILIKNGRRSFNWVGHDRRASRYRNGGLRRTEELSDDINQPPYLIQRQEKVKVLWLPQSIIALLVDLAAIVVRAVFEILPLTHEIPRSLIQL